MNTKKFVKKARLKIALCGSFIILSTIMITYGSEKSWKDYQREYTKKIAAKAGMDIRKFTPGEKIIAIPELGIRDRCITCHVGMNQLQMFGEKNPFKPHPSNYLQHHPPNRFGCTTCHGGEGASLSMEKAHGKSFRKRDLVQVSCSKCHIEEVLGGALKVSHGKFLLKQNQCIDCHYTKGLSETEKFKFAPALKGIGSKTNEKWLWRWLKDPKSYMSNASMPHYDLDEKYIDALVGYLAHSKDYRLKDEFQYPEGDVDTGKGVLRLAFCISCHSFAGKGGTTAPDLGRIGNKVEEKWLVQMLQNPHRFQPDTPMPRYNFNEHQLSDMAAYLLDEFTDFDMADADDTVKLPHFWADSKERIEIGRRVYKELRCANCHGVLEKNGWWRKIGPEFTMMGDKPVHEINFGDSKVFRTLPDYIFEKIRNPQIYATKDNVMKMPKYDLSNQEIKDMSLALLSFNSDKVGAKDYRFPKENLLPADSNSIVLSSRIYPSVETKNKKYEPTGEFARLVNKFRCFSCHSFKGRGNNIAYDLSIEGSRVQRKWFYNYLKVPYSLRPILTIRMPIFKMKDKEIKALTSGFMCKMSDPKMETNLENDFTPEMILKGKKMFEKKGCLACHQLGNKGGYVGPSFTQGALVGEKLKSGWTFKWLKNPQAMKPDVLEPNFGLSDKEALNITAYLMSIKGPQQKGSINGK